MKQEKKDRMCLRECSPTRQQTRTYMLRKWIKEAWKGSRALEPRKDALASLRILFLRKHEARMRAR